MLPCYSQRRRQLPNARRVRSIFVPLLWLSAYAAVVGVASGAGSATTTNSDSAILELTNGTFDDTLQASPTVLVQFYAPWCGHCKKFAPEYQKLAEALVGKAVVGRVDITKEEPLVERFGIEGFPTVFLFRHGGDPEEFMGTRDSASLAAWVESRSGAVLQLLPSEDSLQGELRKRRTLPYVVLRGGSARFHEAFAELAETNRKLAVYFAFVSEQGGGPSASPARLQIHRGVSELLELAIPRDVEDQSSVENILRLLRPELLAAFGEIGEENYEPYFEKAMAQGNDGAVLWVCFPAESFHEDAVRHDATFREIAAAFPKYLVVYMDTKLYHEHAVEDLGCKVFPTLSLQLGNFTSQAHDALKRYKLELAQPPPEELPSAALESNPAMDDPTKATAANGTANISATEVIEWIRTVQDGKVEADDDINFDYDEEEEMQEDETEGTGADQAASASNAGAAESGQNAEAITANNEGSNSAAASDAGTTVDGILPHREEL